MKTTAMSQIMTEFTLTIVAEIVIHLADARSSIALMTIEIATKATGINKAITR